MKLEISSKDLLIIKRSLEHTLETLDDPKYATRHGKEATNVTIALANDLYLRVVAYEETT